jgi:ribosomal protein S18 acetylase RimI-like enzyme
VVALWHECGLIRPWNDPVKDIARKLRVQRDLFVVGILDGRLVATVMAGYEGHRGWINYLAVARECRQRGFGRRLMDEAEARLRAIGCPKINLLIRRSNPEAIGFYRSLGFAEDDSISLGKRLVDD